MDLTGKISGISVGYLDGKANITFQVNEKSDVKLLYDTFNNVEKLDIKVVKHREKRSLNANNYAWKLITEIANKLRVDKEEMYIMMLKKYGQSEIISVLSHIPILEYVKYCEEAGESKLNGKLFKHYKVFKGSSEFNTQEMAIFIDGIVEDAKEMGIPTETPEQIANLKNLWGE